MSVPELILLPEPPVRRSVPRHWNVNACVIKQHLGNINRVTRVTGTNYVVGAISGRHLLAGELLGEVINFRD